jgi:ABC-type antimicrobial peptide transport system permease subunit
MFFRSGVVLGAIGLVIGLPLSVAAIRVFLSTIGGGIDTPQLNVPEVTVGIALVVISVSSLATWLPARRAARVDPLLALRAE